jgi:hypothetical protein
LGVVENALIIVLIVEVAETAEIDGLEPPMTRDCAGSHVVRAVTLARILTGRMTSAESSVMAAIEALPPDNTSELSFLAEVAKASWLISQTTTLKAQQGEIEPTPLPEELKNVSKLPRELRYSFSMRVLAGLSVEACAEITGLGREQIEYLAQLSMQILARPARIVARLVLTAAH